MPQRCTDKPLELLLLILYIADMQIKNKQMKNPTSKQFQTAILVYPLLETASISFRKGKNYS